MASIPQTAEWALRGHAADPPDALFRGSSGPSAIEVHETLRFAAFSTGLTRWDSKRTVSQPDANRAREDVAFTRDYRPEVDGLRAVAIAAVLANHLYSKVLPGGFLGVDMFFVISGYVITTSLSRQRHHNFQTHFLDFYCRRFKRILPALLVCVLITCLLGSLLIDPQLPEYSASMKAGALSLMGLSNFWFFKEALDYFGSPARLNLFTHTWSLGVEEQFYLVLPALYLLAVRASAPSKEKHVLLLALGFLTILSFATYLWLNRTQAQAAFYLMPPRFWELGIGCITAFIVLRPRTAGGRMLQARAPWIAAVLLATALLAPADRHLYATPCVVGCTAILIVTLGPGHPLYRLMTLRGVVFVGLISYSLYLWHWSVLSLSRWTIGSQEWWSLPVQVAAMSGLAVASYVYVERPLRRAAWSKSRLLTLGFGTAAVTSSVILILVVNNQRQLKSMLYTGARVQMQTQGAASLLDDKWHSGKLIWPAKDCVLSSEKDAGKTIDPDACTLGERKPPKPHFLVIGNSFSAAQFEMYSILSETGIGSVTVTSSWGAVPVRGMPYSGPWPKANAHYWDHVVPSLMSSLGKGDVVVMINDLAGFGSTSRTNESRLLLLAAELKRMADELGRKGVQIIFQSANPFMREARCTPSMAMPQWFRPKSSTPCTYYTKTDTLKRQARFRETIEHIRSTSPNFHVLDLLPVLCTEEICRFFNGQRVLLYRDIYSHLSIEANYLARPLFLQVAKQAIEPSSGTIPAQQ
jgi:peptidoglycan/LPS O-acetylase OafA/YrhL